MKRLAIFCVAILFTSILFAQKSPVDALFEQYSGKEGYTSIFISKYMFNLFSSIDSNNKEFNETIKGLTGIKILTAESQKQGIDFHKEIMKSLPTSDYKELMVIKEKDQDLKFLIKDVKGKIVELLLIVGGKDNVLISIQGEDISLNNISNLSRSMNIDALDALEKIEDKK